MEVEHVNKTESLNPKRFRQGKQPWLVATALSDLPNPISVEAIVSSVKNNGYENLLNDWAKEHGGVEASVQYQLRYLNRLGMVNF